jgi:hypothetical protein
MVVTLVIVLVIGFGLVVSSFGSVLFQEGNPIPNSKAIFQLIESSVHRDFYNKLEKHS